jgi:predicted Fe-Mo cluster-binding NifX family protein
MEKEHFNKNIGDKMKYAIPIDNQDDLDSIVGQHFGHVPYFAIWDQDSNSLDIIENRSNHKGGVGLPMEFLAPHCNGVFLKGAGAKAVMLGQQLGLEVYMGADGTVKETIEKFKAGELFIATKNDGCSH